jgi:hypothetical protein
MLGVPNFRWINLRASCEVVAVAARRCKAEEVCDFAHKWLLQTIFLKVRVSFMSQPRRFAKFDRVLLHTHTDIVT